MTQLRKMMLEELQRRNYSKTTVNAYLKMVESFANHFHRSPDQLGPEEIRLSGAPVHRKEVGSTNGRAPHGCIALFLLQDTEAELSHRRSSLSADVEKIADYPDTGRIRPAHRFGEQSLPSRHADDVVFNRHAPGRTLPSQGRGYR